MNKGSKYKSGQRLTFRIWDNEKNDWFEPTYEGWDGKIEELLLSPTGNLAMRTLTDFKRGSIFSERFEIVLDEPQKVRAKLAKHWHEDVGDCLWWDFPVEEPPYCGTPLDDDFPSYKTHFTQITMPDEVEEETKYYIRLTIPSSSVIGLYLGFNKDGKFDTSYGKPHITWGWKCRFTEKEIKAIDERYWAFAVPVEKVEV